MNDDMDQTPVDLSTLDPTRDAARFGEAVTAIVREAMATAQLRRSAPGGEDGLAFPEIPAHDVFDRLVQWWPATLAAATLILAVSISGLLRSIERSAPTSAMDVLGISVELSDVLRSHETPSLSELRAALTMNPGQ